MTVTSKRVRFSSFTLMRYTEIVAIIEEVPDSENEQWNFAIFASNTPGDASGDEEVESGIADSRQDAEASVLHAIERIYRTDA